MKEQLKLKNPIDINGRKVSTLNYDTEEINALLFTEAEARKLRAAGSKGGNISGAAELDYSFHLYLGFAAIIAVNPDIDFSDLERIKGQDIKEVMNIGRNFIMLRSEEASEEGGSDEQSGITPEPSTPPSLT